MPYNPALDGLRAVAVMLVVLFHAHAPVALGGYIGVDIFFVLSGYLITSLLLSELDAKGRLNLRRFYLRRFLRLTPALIAMLTIYVAIAPFLWPATANHAAQAATAAMYLSDYAVAFWNTPDILSHTWSLSVEEHFYLLWPLALLAAYRRWDSRSLVWVLGTGYLLATLVRWVCIVRGQSWEQVYYRFDTHMSGLILGGWLAALLRDRVLVARLQRALPWLMWAPLMAVICLQYRWGDLWMPIWGLSVAEWATVALLAAVQTPQSQAWKMLSQAPLVWLGKISYGVYLWHYPIFRYLRGDHHWSEVLMVGLPLSIALAAVSYYTVEAWAARRRVLVPGFAASQLT
jgi:peptidoglycan/LPS O-acetylase OafA/YrhL